MCPFDNVGDLNRFSEIYLDFLVSDHGFTKTSFRESVDYLKNVSPPERSHITYHSKYHIRYKKDKVKIEFILDVDSVALPAFRYEHADHGENAVFSIFCLEGETPVMKRVRSRREIWMGGHMPGANWLTSRNRAISVEDDYEKYARFEMELFIKEYGALLDRHPKILEGDVSDFIKKAL